jgi:hypothetical protein
MVLFCVMFVICVLCLIVVLLPPAKNPFAVKINTNNNNNNNNNNNIHRQIDLNAQAREAVRNSTNSILQSFLSSV